MTRFIFLAASVHSCSEISPSLNVSGGVNVRSSWKEDAAERDVDGTNEDGATNAVAPGKSADDDARAVAAAPMVKEDDPFIFVHYYKKKLCLNLIYSWG